MSIRKYIVYSTLLFTLPYSACAQYSAYHNFQYDSIQFDSKTPPANQNRFHKTIEKITNNQFFKMNLVAAPLIVSGLVIKREDDKFRNLRNYSIPHFSWHYDDYLQYSPAVAMLALKVAGVEGYSSWPRMLVADGFSAGVMALAVNSLKYSCKIRRPDGSTRNSFPSGHTATAFMAATMLHKEYGLTKSPLYSIAGYSVATFTGVSRMMNNRHWMSDVMVGAGIGVLSTEIGYYIASLIFKEKGLNYKSNEVLMFDYKKPPSFIGLNIGFDIMPIHFNLAPQIVMKALPGSNVGIEGAWFKNRYFGIGGKLSVSYMPLSLTQPVPDFNLGEKSYHIVNFQSDALNPTSFYIGPYLSIPLVDQCLLNFKIHPGLIYIKSNDFSVFYKDKSNNQIVQKRDFMSIDHSFNIGINAGSSINYIFTPKLRLKFFFDYTLFPSRFETNVLVRSKFEHHKVLHTFTLGSAVEIMLWK